MDLKTRFAQVVAGLIGKGAPGQPPVYDLMAMYRAEVVTCASDGSTCDVQPEDKRIGGANGVPVRVGIPGLQAIVQPGAVVLLGWERGDPGRPYCVPSWEGGATVMKMIINATLIHLGAQAGAQFVALANLVNTELGKIATALATHTHPVTAAPGTTGPGSGGYSAGNTSATQVKAV